MRIGQGRNLVRDTFELPNGRAKTESSLRSVRRQLTPMLHAVYILFLPTSSPQPTADVPALSVISLLFFSYTSLPTYYLATNFFLSFFVLFWSFVFKH